MDHKMILHKNDPLVGLLQENGEPIYVMDKNPTAENIAREIFDYTAKLGFPVTEVRLWETNSCYASYQE